MRQEGKISWRNFQKCIDMNNDATQQGMKKWINIKKKNIEHIIIGSRAGFQRGSHWLKKRLLYQIDKRRDFIRNSGIENMYTKSYPII